MLVKRSLNLPRGVMRRYSAYVVDTLDVIRFDDFKVTIHVGCMNLLSDCHSWKRYKKIQEECEWKFTPDDESFIVKFGHKLKFCGGCVCELC